MIDLGSQPDLRSDRLWLTPFVDSDAPAVFDYARNPNVSQHTTWITHGSLTQSHAFIEMVQNYEDDFCWAIRLAPDGVARGAVEFGLDNPSKGSVHYVLAEELWSQGLMTEAVLTVMRWAFESFESLSRVATAATSANLGSRRVLEKCGFRFIELATEKWDKFDEPVELAAYAITREEWAATSHP